MSLQDQMDDDLDIFFDLEAFAVIAMVGGVAINGIFDEEYIETLETAGTRPVLYCKTSDVAALAFGDAVTVNGTNYTAGNPEPDGTGVTRIELTVV